MEYLIPRFKKTLFKKETVGGNISQSYFSPFNVKETVSPRNKVGMLPELKCKDWQYNVKTIAQLGRYKTAERRQGESVGLI